ncbi:facilitated trehalose transporter Tret1 isoform X2 [Dendroctonus ponderosae]|uniref:Major facilitator superfamily (MFS) profile domain-containing protein n=1 Tax=Dendroctonus ponderosae TaxID=77166 RepID=A0AAR5P963_DENPD|nr:facilitated trehalose transporter Tret1 isoform X2 [Dendroctonus ponderosae]KAH1022582.1 hypothetical protein HUJ04_011964 [Dendroctonus ponderosae]KAH1029083.1 hypothetical protein HUJ05_002382 [Dendroctonus ponderosae]
MVEFTRKVSTFQRFLPQIIAVIIKNSSLFVYGTTMGMPTILIPALSGNNQDESLSMDETGISWIASMSNLCVPLGCLLSGQVAQKIGRKRALQAVNVPFSVAFALFYFASKPWQILFGLSLTGTAGGIAESPGVSYSAEVSEPILRGGLTSSGTLFISMGILFSFIGGTFFHWRTLALINAVIPLVSTVLLMLIPETPYWLVSKNRMEEAQKSLAWLRGWTSTEQVEKEFQEIRKSIEVSAQEDSNRTWRSNLQLYMEGRFIKPFLLIALTFVTAYFGLTPVTAYAVEIFNLLQVPLSSYYATVLMGSLNLIATILCAIILRFFGKRLLAFIALSGVSLCFIITASYCFLNDIYFFSSSAAASTSSWIPMVALMGMGFFSYLVVFGLPWILMGEIYHNEIRDTATGLSAAIGYLIGFLASKTFQQMVSAVTLPGVFLFYSGVAVGGILALYFLLPETEGKSLAECCQHYSGGSKLDNRVCRNRGTDKENEHGV